MKGFFLAKFIYSFVSVIFFESLEFKNIFLQDDFIFLQIEKNNNKDIFSNKVFLINCSFEKVYSNSNLAFLIANDLIDEFILKNSTFKQISTNNEIICINQHLMNATIENSIFSSNMVISNILILSSQLISIQNLTCAKNRDFENSNQLFNCFRFYEIIKIKIYKVMIVDNLSYKSAFFVIENNKIGNCSIIIKEGMFFSNILIVKSIINNLDLGGVFKITTYSEVVLENLTFLKNILETNRKIFVAGPCMHIISKNIIEIRNSFFKENKSSKLTNCLYIICDILNIFESKFFNNSISILTEKDYNYLYISREYGEALFPVEESKGGTLFFAGKKLYINNSCFIKNKANVGSAIYVEESKNDKDSTTVKIENSVFYFNQALRSSTIALNLISYFECEIYRNLIIHNYAKFGGVTNLNLKKTAKIMLTSNFIMENQAISGVSIFLESGPAVLFGTNNTFYKNEPRSLVGKIGAGAYTVNIGGSVFLENEKYYKNAGYHGITGFFASRGYEKNGVYIKNTALYISAVGTSHKSIYFGVKLRVYHNYAEKFGAITSLDESDIYLEDVIFFNMSSANRGACIFIQDQSKLLIYNSSFFKNNQISLNIIDVVMSNQESTFKNCIFMNNSVKTKFFDVSYSLVLIADSFFASNNGTILYIIENSQITLNEVKLFNTISHEDIISNDNSFMNLSSCFFYIMNINKNLIYSYNSMILAKNIFLKRIFVLEIGGFINSQHCDIIISALFINDLINNCFFFEYSSVDIDQGSYINLNQIKEAEFESVFYASFSNFFSLRNFLFMRLKNATVGNSFLHILNSQTAIQIFHSYFYFGFTLTNGGAIESKDSNVSIDKCIFFSNKAKRGGTIFFTSNSSKILKIITV